MKFISSIVLVFLLHAGFASGHIPNAGFEDWTSQGFPAYLDPAEWNTLNDQTGILNIYTVTRAEGADAFAGNYAMRMETDHIPSPFDRVTPAITTTGKIDTDEETIEGGFPLTEKPDTLSGWFRYYPADGDNCDITITLTRWNESIGETEQIGEGTFTFSDKVDTYRQFVIAIEYSKQAIPDTALIIISASNPLDPKPGSVLYLDDLEMTMSENAINSAPR
ncbi:MAG: hypothetical protein EA412_14550 [Chitinophagaceae bacterium]|nr:MAG: hypothetical protein EA412_14550 [Chitinophagaceae bacterium]